MNNIVELFGISTSAAKTKEQWARIISSQQCPFYNDKCYKTRKSDPDVAIGSCTVLYGTPKMPVVICPDRLTERKQIFADCLHLLTNHEPGNELHILSEISIPGGTVDYFLVSAKGKKVRDFVGIEIQTLDTTGTVWPDRQRLLTSMGLGDRTAIADKSYGMNWKMTAKTILVQMHHKVETFEHINKKLALVIQTPLLEYMKTEFAFSHLSSPPQIGHSVHIHAYALKALETGGFKVELNCRLSTDADGVGKCLNLQTEAKVELSVILEALEKEISDSTRFMLGG